MQKIRHFFKAQNIKIFSTPSLKIPKVINVESVKDWAELPRDDVKEREGCLL